MLLHEIGWNACPMYGVEWRMIHSERSVGLMVEVVVKGGRAGRNVFPRVTLPF